jgi:RsiW-degrading membrane proteinase PrsW (M82 family)
MTLADLYFTLNSLNTKNIAVGLAALFSILPVSYILLSFHPSSKEKKLGLLFVSLFAGMFSTAMILRAHDILWPTLKTTKTTTVLSQTIHIAFIQAGMLEETFKIVFIVLLSLLFAFQWKEKRWTVDVTIIACFVALGFALVENFMYISKSYDTKFFDTFMGRTLYSSNIHLLIDLCFALFLLKSNDIHKKKYLYLLYAFFLAVVQHGIVDFFLIPPSRFGTWLATAFFVGIWVWVVRDMRKYVLSGFG